MKWTRADRIDRLPPYLFATLDRMRQDAIRRGLEVVSLGVGDPDLPTPEPVVERLKAAAEEPANHRYPSYEGLLAFRQAVAAWYARRFGVRLDPETEVLTLIGSKEGLGHLPLAVLNPGDVALVPDPAYPVYTAGTVLAGATPHLLPLRQEHGFLPDLDAVPSRVATQAKLLFLNYPNNPTSATAPPDFFQRVCRLAERHGWLVCHDAAYSEIFYDGVRPRSFLETPGAKEVGIEFHSLSKTYNMTGWRIGFVVGQAKALAALGRIKSNLDSGVFQAVQEAGITALGLDDAVLDGIRRVYQVRRDLLIRGLTDLGFAPVAPQATFYCWMPVPGGEASEAFSHRLLERAGILTTPGRGFGEAGEGYIRMALTVGRETLARALERWKHTGPGAHATLGGGRA